jgi:NADP-dependent 3-hydroxy acid dehydrogenase YdfG
MRGRSSIVGKLAHKIAVITGATSGMALATAKLFVDEGAYVFITGRDQTRLDRAVKTIGRNVTGVQGDAGNLADLDRLYETVKREQGRLDVLFASAGYAEFAAIGDVTEEQFDKIIGLNVRGTLFTVQKALPLFSDGGSIILNGSIASSKGFPAFGVYNASKAAVRSSRGRGRSTSRPATSASTRSAPARSRRTSWTAFPRRPWTVSSRSFREARSVSPRRSRPPRSSWPPAIPASSPASSCSSTAASPRSERRYGRAPRAWRAATVSAGSERVV